jgi:ketosteroid isomerase-like protein
MDETARSLRWNGFIWSGKIAVMSDSRVTLAEDFFQKAFGGDVSAACKLLDPQVVEVVPGTRAPSGVFRGVQAVAAHLSTFLRLTEDPIDVLQWEDWLSGIDNVAGLAKIHLQRQGEQHDFRVIFLVTVIEDDARQRISRIESFYSDQAAFDRFFSVQS